MNLLFAIQSIGWSHLLQPPLTLMLAKQLRLEPAFMALPPLAAQIARNMALVSVALPTSLGMLVGLGAPEIVAGGFMRYLAWTVALLWSWRLYRQMIIGPMMPTRWHWGLCAIFVVQGPGLAAVLIALR